MSDLIAELHDNAPPGWFVHLDAVPDANGDLRPCPGQVIVVTYATHPQHTPTQPVNAAEAEPVSDDPRPANEEPAEGQDSRTPGSASSSDSDHSVPDGHAVADSRPGVRASPVSSVSTVFCAVFAPSFQPERLVLPIPGRVNRDTVQEYVAFRRQPHYQRYAPELIFVQPQPFERCLTMLAQPTWLGDGVPVLCQLCGPAVAAFALRVPSVTTKADILRLANCDEDHLVYVADADRALGDTALAHILPGDLISVVARGHTFVRTTVESVIASDWLPQWPSHFNAEPHTVWALAEDVAQAIHAQPRRNTTFQDVVAAALEIPLPRLWTVPAKPAIRDYAHRGVGTVNVVLALCQEPENPVASAHTIPYVLDQRPVLLSLSIAWAREGRLDVAAVHARVATRCPTGFFVRIRGGTAEPGHANHYRQVRPGEVIVVEFWPRHIGDGISLHSDSSEQEDDDEDDDASGPRQDNPFSHSSHGLAPFSATAAPSDSASSSAADAVTGGTNRPGSRQADLWRNYFAGHHCFLPPVHRVRCGHCRIPQISGSRKLPNRETAVAQHVCSPDTSVLNFAQPPTVWVLYGFLFLCGLSFTALTPFLVVAFAQLGTTCTGRRSIQHTCCFVAFILLTACVSSAGAIPFSVPSSVPDGRQQPPEHTTHVVPGDKHIAVAVRQGPRALPTPCRAPTPYMPLQSTSSEADVLISVPQPSAQENRSASGDILRTLLEDIKNLQQDFFFFEASTLLDTLVEHFNADFGYGKQVAFADSASTIEEAIPPPRGPRLEHIQRPPTVSAVSTIRNPVISLTDSIPVPPFQASALELQTIVPCLPGRSGAPTIASADWLDADLRPLLCDVAVPPVWLRRFTAIQFWYPSAPWDTLTHLEIFTDGSADGGQVREGSLHPAAWAFTVWAATHAGRFFLGFSAHTGVPPGTPYFLGRALTTRLKRSYWLLLGRNVGPWNTGPSMECRFSSITIPSRQAAAPFAAPEYPNSISRMDPHLYRSSSRFSDRHCPLECPLDTVT